MLIFFQIFYSTEQCLLSNDIYDYNNVAQGKITIPNVDDGAECLATDVSVSIWNQKKMWSSSDVFVHFCYFFDEIHQIISVRNSRYDISIQILFFTFVPIHFLFFWKNCWKQCSNFFITAAIISRRCNHRDCSWNVIKRFVFQIETGKQIFLKIFFAIFSGSFFKI